MVNFVVSCRCSRPTSFSVCVKGGAMWTQSPAAAAERWTLSTLRSQTPLSSADQSPPVTSTTAPSSTTACPLIHSVRIFFALWTFMNWGKLGKLHAPAPLFQRTPESSSSAWIQRFSTTQTALCSPTRAFCRAVTCHRWWRTAGLCPRRWTSAASSSCARCRSRSCASWRSPSSSASSF